MTSRAFRCSSERAHVDVGADPRSRDGADDYMTKPFLPRSLARTAHARHEPPPRTPSRAPGARADRAGGAEAVSATCCASHRRDHRDAFARTWPAVSADETRDELRAPRRSASTSACRAVDVRVRGDGWCRLSTGGPCSSRTAPAPIHASRVRDPHARHALAMWRRSSWAQPRRGPGGRRRRDLDPRADRLLRIVADRVAARSSTHGWRGRRASWTTSSAGSAKASWSPMPRYRVAFANTAFARWSAGPRLRGAVDRLSRRRAETAALTERMKQPTFQGEVLLIPGSGEPRPVLISLSSVPREGGPLQRSVCSGTSAGTRAQVPRHPRAEVPDPRSLAAGVAPTSNIASRRCWAGRRCCSSASPRRDARSGDLGHALTVINQGASDSVGTVRRLQEYARPVA